MNIWLDAFLDRLVIISTFVSTAAVLFVAAIVRIPNINDNIIPPRKKTVYRRICAFLSIFLCLCALAFLLDAAYPVLPNVIGRSKDEARQMIEDRKIVKPFFISMPSNEETDIVLALFDNRGNTRYAGERVPRNLQITARYAIVPTSTTPTPTPTQMLILAEPPEDDTAQPISFVDLAFELMLREALNRPTGPIFPSELANCTRVVILGENLTLYTPTGHWYDPFEKIDYTGKMKAVDDLLLFPSLKELTIRGQSFENLTAISNLTKLRALFLDGTNISDLTPLSGLTGLDQLELSQNNITNVTPLSGLDFLTKLRLCNNQISNIKPLESLVSLTELDLFGNQISNISPLASLKSLTKLSLFENRINDITPLAGLNKLTNLNLCRNQISDISPLEGLHALTVLDIWGNEISDITPLKGLNSLIEMDIFGNRISDISPLAGLDSLTWLWLDWNQISDLSPLADLHRLTRLSLDGNQIRDISPLAGLESLTELHLGHNKITDVSSLKSLSNLQYLCLESNPLSANQIAVLQAALPNCTIDLICTHE